MLDARLLRSDPDMLRKALARRDADGLLDEAISLDERRRALQTRVDELRARRNAASEQIGAAMKRVKEDLAHVQRRQRHLGGADEEPVSYTHLTLPTN